MQRRKRKSLVLGILRIILLTVSIVFNVLEYKGLYIVLYILGFVFFTWMFIYNLICKDTIDERVAEIVSSKQAMSDYIVDDKMTTASIDILRKYIEDLI